MILNKDSKICAVFLLFASLFDLLDSINGRVVLLSECIDKNLTQVDISICVKNNSNELKLYFNTHLNNYLLFLVMNVITTILFVDNLFKDIMVNETSDNLFQKKILVKTTMRYKIKSVAKGLWISVMIWTQIIMKELEYSSTGVLMNEYLYYPAKFGSKVLILLLYLTCLMALILIYTKSELFGINKINIMNYSEIDQMLSDGDYKIITIDNIVKRQEKILLNENVLNKIFPHFNFGHIRQLITFDSKYDNGDTSVEDLMSEAMNMGLDFHDDMLSLEVKF